MAFYVEKLSGHLFKTEIFLSPILRLRLLIELFLMNDGLTAICCRSSSATS